jgi:hypothetical protein
MGQVGRDEAARILKGGFGRELLHAATNYSAPIFWANPPSHGTSLTLNNATMFFLECGGPILGITAGHVFDAFRKRREREADLVCQLGNMPFDPNEQVLDFDPRLDIATFRITEGQIERLGRWVYRCAPERWPPTPPSEGKGVFLAGFPGEERIVESADSINFGIYTAILTATVVKEAEIVCQFQREDFVDVLGLGLPGYPQQLGGLSGAALWTLTQNDYFAWRLGGVVIEFGDASELLRARRPDCIRPDGSLIR